MLELGCISNTKFSLSELKVVLCFKYWKQCCKALKLLCNCNRATSLQTCLSVDPTRHPLCFHSVSKSSLAKDSLKYLYNVIWQCPFTVSPDGVMGLLNQNWVLVALPGSFYGWEVQVKGALGVLDFCGRNHNFAWVFSFQQMPWSEGLCEHNGELIKWFWFCLQSIEDPRAWQGFCRNIQTPFLSSKS